MRLLDRRASSPAPLRGRSTVRISPRIMSGRQWLSDAEEEVNEWQAAVEAVSSEEEETSDGYTSEGESVAPSDAASVGSAAISSVSGIVPACQGCSCRGG